jgi:hypothetical protein
MKVIKRARMAMKRRGPSKMGGWVPVGYFANRPKLLSNSIGKYENTRWFQWPNTTLTA